MLDLGVVGCLSGLFSGVAWVLLGVLGLCVVCCLSCLISARDIEALSSSFCQASLLKCQSANGNATRTGYINFKRVWLDALLNLL